MKVKVLYICSFTCVARNRKEHMHVYCFNANHTFVVASPSPCNPSRVQPTRSIFPAQARSFSLLQRIIRCATPSPWISPSDIGASFLNTARRFTKYAITCNHTQLHTTQCTQTHHTTHPTKPLPIATFIWIHNLQCAICGHKATCTPSSYLSIHIEYACQHTGIMLTRGEATWMCGAAQLECFFHLHAKSVQYQCKQIIDCHLCIKL